MSTLHKSLFVLLGLSLALTSCKKDDPEDPMTDDQAADLIESILSSEDGGVSEDYISSAKIAVEEYPAYQFDCSFSGDSTFHRSISGARTFDVSSILSWSGVCAGGQVTSLEFALSNQTTYSGPALSRVGSSTGQLVLTNLASSYATLALSGNLSSTGNATYGSKISDTDVNMTFTNVAVDKTSYKIVSGTASITITASLNGTSVTKTAQVTFNGNTATITINGNTYTFTMY